MGSNYLRGESHEMSLWHEALNKDDLYLAIWQSRVADILALTRLQAVRFLHIPLLLLVGFYIKKDNDCTFIK